ncbi:ribosomal protein S18-alanine N-acetyltransferase [Aquisalimonas sp.]|uniref:ribosomal protein S18-alanine N-acetyltransferase n=1 Tax=unclassified Aquisalimonas TaxID=2644645 RepID=UPI0025C2589A|nr:ribosomal protein S18-alanine N-acetyltransferase [Aquisalimonas sp.]
MNAVVTAESPEMRRMREHDLPEVLAIERNAYDFPWTAAVFRDCMRVGYGCWVLLDDGRVSGYLVMSVVAGEGHVLNLCVDPARHGQGFGRTLLESGIEHARRLGAETVFLEVRPSNRRAVNLYHRNGFCEVGVRPQYYPVAGGRREDALILARDLGSVLPTRRGGAHGSHDA